MVYLRLSRNEFLLKLDISTTSDVVVERFVDSRLLLLERTENVEDISA